MKLCSIYTDGVYRDDVCIRNSNGSFIVQISPSLLCFVLESYAAFVKDCMTHYCVISLFWLFWFLHPFIVDQTTIQAYSLSLSLYTYVKVQAWTERLTGEYRSSFKWDRGKRTTQIQRYHLPHFCSSSCFFCSPLVQCRQKNQPFEDTNDTVYICRSKNYWFFT